MKTILVPFHDDDSIDSALETTRLIATAFGAYFEGLYVRQTQPVIVGDGITLPPEYLKELSEESEQRATKARERYNRLVKSHDIPFRDVGQESSTPTAGWRSAEGRESDVVGDYGRLFDLIVIGRFNERSSIGWESTCEAALFESGRPVIVAPKTAPESVGERIVIAWNRSTETARTIGLAMPFLTRAQAVTVVEVEGGTVPGPDAEQLARHLSRNGIAAAVRFASAGRNAVGEVILQEAARANADLVLKGAYTQSRFRQMIFGGPTSHILENAAVPVLLAH